MNLIALKKYERLYVSSLHLCTFLIWVWIMRWCRSFLYLVCRFTLLIKVAVFFFKILRAEWIAPCCPVMILKYKLVSEPKYRFIAFQQVKDRHELTLITITFLPYGKYARVLNGWHEGCCNPKWSKSQGFREIVSMCYGIVICRNKDLSVSVRLVLAVLLNTANHLKQDLHMGGWRRKRLTVSVRCLQLPFCGPLVRLFQTK